MKKNKSLKIAKIIILAMVLLLAALPLAACSKPQQAPKKVDEAMPLGAWVAPPPGFTTDAIYKDVADSGINFIHQLFLNEDNDMEALDLCEKYGIKYYVQDRRVLAMEDLGTEELKEILESYIKHPAYGGVLGIDEPGSAKFEQIAKASERYYGVAPNANFYVNMLPTYSSVSQRDGLSYKEYIDKYLEVVKPKVLSYDHYPLRTKVGENSMTNDFLWNHEIVANAAKKANTPFWTFIQAMGFATAGIENRIPASTADIRMQVYTSLAFGAKGIQYFCYWSPDNSHEVFTLAMVDKEGNKTSTYDMVKTVNQEIKSFEQYYLGFKSVGVMTFPQEDTPEDMFLDEPLKNWKPIKKVESSNPLVIGCLEDDLGNEAMVLVNYGEPTANLSNEVTIKLNGYKEAWVYGIGAEETKTEIKSNEYKVTLEPGEGSFVILRKNKS